MATVTPIASVRTILDAADDAAASSGVIALMEDNRINYDPLITGLVGGGATKLDGITTVGVAVGRVQLVMVAGTPHFYSLRSGGANGGPETIYVEPADYNALTNSKVWALLSFFAPSIVVLNGDLTIQNDIASGSLTIDSVTDARIVSLPDNDGTMALWPIVTPSTPTTGGTISPTRYVDETHYVTPAGTLANLTWNLPLAADSRVGQVKVFLSTQTITTLTVTVLGSGTKAGAALTAAVANEAYSYQCVSTSGNGTWLRIS